MTLGETIVGLVEKPNDKELENKFKDIIDYLESN